MKTKTKARRKRDKYDEAVEYLTKYPDSISHAWKSPTGCDAGCLFQFVESRPGLCGCLSQIRAGRWDAETPQLTAAIRADGRIPVEPEDITVNHLPVFAEWQRKIDRILKRK